MWWREPPQWRAVARLAVVLAAARPDRRLLAAALRHAPVVTARKRAGQVRRRRHPADHGARRHAGTRLARRHAQRAAIRSAQRRRRRVRADLSAHGHVGSSQYHRRSSIPPPAGRHADRHRRRRLISWSRSPPARSWSATAPSRMSITTFPARSSASPTARRATPKTGGAGLAETIRTAGVVFRRRHLKLFGAAALTCASRLAVSRRDISCASGRVSPDADTSWSRSKLQTSTDFSRGPIRRGRWCWSSARTPAWSANASTR